MACGDCRTIALEVELPEDMADKAERIAKDEPEFFRRLILAAVVRKEIFEGIKERADVR